MKMSFRDKLNNHFREFTVSAPNFPLNNKYLFADYIELISLFSGPNYVSLADIQDRLTDEGILKLEEEDSSDTDEIGSDASAKNDEAENKVRDIFIELEQRSYLFDDLYPFEYTDYKIRIKDELLFKHELYLMLLVSSNLNQFDSFQGELTTEFEKISFFALKKFLPTNASIKSFGRNSEYTGNAITKIKALADDMNIEVNDYEMSHIAKGNTQERGLDLIGWLPFKDEVPNMVVILGQCACGKNWSKKNHDTSRFKNYFRFYKSKPIQSLFIPYSLIDYKESKYYSSDDIEEGCLMFERKRLIDYFEEEDFFNDLKSKKLVDECIKVTEDLV